MLNCKVREAVTHGYYCPFPRRPVNPCGWVSPQSSGSPVSKGSPGWRATPTPSTVCHFVGALSLILPQTARESVGLDHWESYDKEVRWRVLKQPALGLGRLSSYLQCPSRNPNQQQSEKITDEMGKTFLSYLSDKGLMSKIYEELI